MNRYDQQGLYQRPQAQRQPQPIPGRPANPGAGQILAPNLNPVRPPTAPQAPQRPSPRLEVPRVPMPGAGAPQPPQAGFAPAPPRLDPPQGNPRLVPRMPQVEAPYRPAPIAPVQPRQTVQPTPAPEYRIMPWTDPAQGGLMQPGPIQPWAPDPIARLLATRLLNQQQQSRPGGEFWWR